MQDPPVVFLFHIPKTGGTSLREALSKEFGLNEGFIHLGPYGDRVRHEQKLKPLEQFTPDELDRVRVLSGHYLSTSFEKYFPGRDIIRIVLLRDPATRILSQYNHAMRNRSKLGLKAVDFHEWYENLALERFDWPNLYGKKLTLKDKMIAISSAGHNYMSKFILDAAGIRNYQVLPDDEIITKANEFLETFTHVGCIEKLQYSINAFNQLFDINLDVGTHNKTGRFVFSKLARHKKMTDDMHRYLTRNNRADYSIYSKWCSDL